MPCKQCHKPKVVSRKPTLPPDPPLIPKSGEIYHGGLASDYIVAKAGVDKLTLVNMHTGNVWADPQTPEELARTLNRKFVCVIGRIVVEAK